jgi:hypothetical protein
MQIPDEVTRELLDRGRIKIITQGKFSDKIIEAKLEIVIKGQGKEGSYAIRNLIEELIKWVTLQHGRLSKMEEKLEKMNRLCRERDFNEYVRQVEAQIKFPCGILEIGGEMLHRYWSHGKTPDDLIYDFEAEYYGEEASDEERKRKDVELFKRLAGENDTVSKEKKIRKPN